MTREDRKQIKALIDQAVRSALGEFDRNYDYEYGWVERSRERAKRAALLGVTDKHGAQSSMLHLIESGYDYASRTWMPGAYSARARRRMGGRRP